MDELKIKVPNNLATIAIKGLQVCYLRTCKGMDYVKFGQYDIVKEDGYRFAQENDGILAYDARVDPSKRQEMALGYLEPVSGKLFCDGIDEMNTIYREGLDSVCYAFQLDEQDTNHVSLTMPKGKIQTVDKDIKIANPKDYLRSTDWFLSPSRSPTVCLLYHEDENRNGNLYIDQLVRAEIDNDWDYHKEGIMVLDAAYQLAMPVTSPQIPTVSHKWV